MQAPMGEMAINPLLSIITPSYNQGEYIRETIASVVAQGCDNIEYIIVDNESKDNTVEIIKFYAEKYAWIKWVSERDNNQGDALTKGFRMAKGSLLAWINSDDLYEPGAIAAVIDYFLKHPETGMVYGDAWIIDRRGDKLKKYEFTRDFDLWSLVHIWDYIVQPAVFFRRSLFEDVGGLDPTLNWCLDWDLWIRMAKVTTVAYLPRSLAASREYRETKTHTGGGQRLAEIRRLMIKHSGNGYFPPRGYWIYYFDTLSRSLGENFISRVFRKMTVHLLIRVLVGKPK